MGSVQSNLLLLNAGGHFVLDNNRSGLDLIMSGGGLGIGDLNDDGMLDMLIPQWDAISLMVSNGDGRWYDHADALGLTTDTAAGQRVGWGAELADLDNDGDLDAVVAYGHLDVDLPMWDNPTRQPDALFLQQPDHTFVDVARQWQVNDKGTQRGFVVADLNQDGWLDLVKRDVFGPDLMYLSRCGDAHWLEIALRDDGSLNTRAVGATVRVRAGGRTFLRTVSAGGTGFGSGGPPEVHVGLGDVDVVDYIEVVWPDGTESVVGMGLEADQRVQVHRQRSTSSMTKR